MAQSLDSCPGQDMQVNNDECLCVIFAHQLYTFYGHTEKLSGQDQAIYQMGGISNLSTTVYFF